MCGEAGLEDQSPKPKHVWNRIPDEVRRQVVKLALNPSGKDGNVNYRRRNDSLNVQSETLLAPKMNLRLHLRGSVMRPLQQLRISTAVTSPTLIH